MAWFRKKTKPQGIAEGRKVQMPEGLWVKCPDCNEMIYKKEVIRNSNICPKCNYHFRLSAHERLDLILDQGWEELFTDIVSMDPLNFSDSKKYSERLISTMKKTGLKDAVVCSKGKIECREIIVAAMDFFFMGGSMGSAVGEKITLAAEQCLEQSIPFIIVSCSGGARMQEGAISLMQLAKISAALARLKNRGIPFISVMTDPTSGGVTASYAMLGDINIAEPKALICFAGPRVIQQTIREELPEGFQKSEFLLEHGMLDFIVERKDMKSVLAKCLDFMWYG